MSLLTFNRVFRTFIDKSNANELRKANIRKIRDLSKLIYDDNNNIPICFVCGAGISISVGVSNWEKLLSSAIGKLIYTFAIEDEQKVFSENDKALSKLKKCEKGDNYKFIEKMDLLEVADYINNYIGNTYKKDYDDVDFFDESTNAQMVALIRSCMYMSDTVPEEKKARIGCPNYGGSTLEAVAKSIIEIYNKNKLNRIITYNYDNLLEYFLEKEISEGHRVIEVKSISHTDQDQRIEDGKINICHIHGKFNVSNMEDASTNIVLSEKSYYNIEKQNYMWSHTLQADAMQNDICIFIGFSARDYNFRRIIKNSQLAEKHLYIIFTIDEFVNNIFGDIIETLHKDDLIKDRERMIDDILSKTNEINADTEIKIKEAITYNKELQDTERDSKIAQLLTSEDYMCERLYLAFLICSQNDYWEKCGIQPIWTTIKQMPKLIKWITKKQWRI